MQSQIAEIEHTVSRVATALNTPGKLEQRIMPSWRGSMPAPEALRDIVDQFKIVLFPDFFDQLRGCRSMTEARLTVSIERLYRLLTAEMTKCMVASDESADDDTARARASSCALSLIDRFPEIKRMLYTDVQAIYDNDPATDDYSEIILSYPVVQAMIHYRLAHEMVKLGVPLLPRILTELAHSLTGIDINPGATIGEYFAIDHGTGVVIGETCIIGKHVTLYQGVTLGAKNFTLDQEGRPVNLPRHPVLEDNVTVYANSTILGRVTIGHDTIIGGNVWLTESVPAYSRVTQHHYQNSNRITTHNPNS